MLIFAFPIRPALHPGRRYSALWFLLLAAAQLALLPSAIAQRSPASQSSAATIVSIQRAKMLLEHGDPQAALALLTPPSARDSVAGQVHTLRGICYTMLGQPIESTAEFDEAIALQPNDAATYFSAGLAAARFNNLNRASDLLSAAARLNPALPGVHYNQALVLARAGRFADSEAQVDQELARKAHPITPPVELWKLKARDAFAQQKWQDTIDSYQKVLALAPGSAEAYASMGQAFYSLNRSQQSKDALRKAVALDPGNGNAHKLLGKLYQDDGNPEAAIPEFETALRLDPTDEEAIYRLLRIYTVRGDRADAARLQQQLSSLKSREMKSSTNEARAAQLNGDGIDLEKKGQLAGALADYEQAAQIDSTNIVFARNAALLLCKMGRTQEAIRYLRDALALEPDDAESLQILAVAKELAAGNHTKKKELPSPQASH